MDTKINILPVKRKSKKDQSIEIPVEEKKVPNKEKIREIIKKPKEKFLTKHQEEYWKVLQENQIVFCVGPAGTGKSFVSLKKSVDLLWSNDNKYEKIVIIKPLVPVGVDIGSLPGNVTEKIAPYIYPSFYLLEKIIGKESLETLIELDIIQTMALSFCRGLNFDNSIIILEEAQNCTPEEMKLILTRIGFNSKMFISGDLEQSDKFKDPKKTGLYDAKQRMRDIKDIGFFEFDVKDIVRNPLIGEILKKYQDV